MEDGVYALESSGKDEAYCHGRHQLGNSEWTYKFGSKLSGTSPR